MKSFNHFIIRLFCYSAILLFTACTDSNTVIEGRLPSDGFDNERVYLVPFKGASSKTVDSTLIRNGSFRFKLKPAKQNQIFIVRVKPILRLELQEILVVSEPGTIQVNLDFRSSSSGTPLNQTLQEWKEKKYVSDSTIHSFRRKYQKEIDETEKALIQSKVEEISKEYRNYADSLVEINKDNPVGELIGSLFDNGEQH